MKHKNREFGKSLNFLIQWMIISITAGITGSILVIFFYSFISICRDFILESKIPVPFWTISGAILCGAIFYRISPTASGDGIPSYIKCVLDKKGSFSFRETFSKFCATFIALITLSSGGILGPAGRVSAGLNSQIAKFLNKFGFIHDNRRTAAICGMSAAVGAIFDAPIGGGIFAVEVLQRANMRYTDLFPAVLSSSIAVYIYHFFPLSSPFSFAIPPGVFESSIMVPILITAFAAAFVGRWYTNFFEFISSLFKKENKDFKIIKLIIGASLSSLTMMILSPNMAGNLKGLVAKVIHGESLQLHLIFQNLPELPIIILFMLLLIIASSLAIASGISVGLISPSILVGLFLGTASASLFGVSPSDPEYYFFLVSGFAGLLSSTVNVPIGAAVIAIECFGASYGFCAGISSIIGFQVNRHHTLYDYTISYTD